MKQLKPYEPKHYPNTFNLLRTNGICDTDDVMVVVPFENDEGTYTAKVVWLDRAITAASEEAQQWGGLAFPDLVHLEKSLPDLWALFSLAEWTVHMYILNVETDELESVHDMIVAAMQEVVDNYEFVKRI